MRLYETVYNVAIVLQGVFVIVLGATYSSPEGPTGTPFSLLVPLSFAPVFVFGVVHVWIDKPRWQLTPTYFWTFANLPLLIVIALVHEYASERAALGLAITVGVLDFLVALTSLVLSFLFPVPKIPTPPGSFRVGTCFGSLVDRDRSADYPYGTAGDSSATYESLHNVGTIVDHDPVNKSKDPRRMWTQIWYPAVPLSDEKRKPVRAKFMSPFIRQFAPKIAESFALPPFIFKHFKFAETHAFVDATPRSHPGDGYPLILFSHGLFGYAAQNTILMECLASCGFVVASVEHAGDAAVSFYGPDDVYEFVKKPDHYVDYSEETRHFRRAGIKTRVADIRHALNVIEAVTREDFDGTSTNSHSLPDDKFRRLLASLHLDLSKVGVSGHSFGGGTTLAVVHEEPRVRAAFVMDGWCWPLPDEVVESDGPSVPIAMVNSHRWEYRDEQEVFRKRIVERRRKFVENITLREARHQTFSDSAFFAHPLVLEGGGTVGPESRKAVTRINRLALAFFCTHLNVQPALSPNVHSLTSASDSDTDDQTDDDERSGLLTRTQPRSVTLAHDFERLKQYFIENEWLLRGGE